MRQEMLEGPTTRLKTRAAKALALSLAVFLAESAPCAAADNPPSQEEARIVLVRAAGDLAPIEAEFGGGSASTDTLRTAGALLGVLERAVAPLLNASSIPEIRHLPDAIETARAMAEELWSAHERGSEPPARAEPYEELAVLLGNIRESCLFLARENARTPRPEEAAEGHRPIDAAQQRQDGAAGVSPAALFDGGPMSASELGLDSLPDGTRLPPGATLEATSIEDRDGYLVRLPGEGEAPGTREFRSWDGSLLIEYRRGNAGGETAVYRRFVNGRLTRIEIPSHGIVLAGEWSESGVMLRGEQSERGRRIVIEPVVEEGRVTARLSRVYEGGALLREQRLAADSDELIFERARAAAGSDRWLVAVNPRHLAGMDLSQFGLDGAAVRRWMSIRGNDTLLRPGAIAAVVIDPGNASIEFLTAGGSPARLMLIRRGGAYEDELWRRRIAGEAPAWELMHRSVYGPGMTGRAFYARNHDTNGRVFYSRIAHRIDERGNWSRAGDWENPAEADLSVSWGEGFLIAASESAAYRYLVRPVGAALGEAGEAIVSGAGGFGAMVVAGIYEAAGNRMAADYTALNSFIEIRKAAAIGDPGERAVEILQDALLMVSDGNRDWILQDLRDDYIDQLARERYLGLEDARSRAARELPENLSRLRRDPGFARFVVLGGGARAGLDMADRAGGAWRALAIGGDIVIELGKGAAGGYAMGYLARGGAALAARALGGARTQRALVWLTQDATNLRFNPLARVPGFGGGLQRGAIWINRRFARFMDRGLFFGKGFAPRHLPGFGGREARQAQAFQRSWLRRSLGGGTVPAREIVRAQAGLLQEVLSAPATAIFGGAQGAGALMDLAAVWNDPSRENFARLAHDAAGLLAFGEAARRGPMFQPRKPASSRLAQARQDAPAAGRARAEDASGPARPRPEAATPSPTPFAEPARRSDPWSAQEAHRNASARMYELIRSAQRQLEGARESREAGRAGNMEAAEAAARGHELEAAMLEALLRAMREGGDGIVNVHERTRRRGAREEFQEIDAETISAIYEMASGQNLSEKLAGLDRLLLIAQHRGKRLAFVLEPGRCSSSDVAALLARVAERAPQVPFELVELSDGGFRRVADPPLAELAAARETVRRDAERFADALRSGARLRNGLRVEPGEFLRGVSRGELARILEQEGLVPFVYQPGYAPRRDGHRTLREAIAELGVGWVINGHVRGYTEYLTSVTADPGIARTHSPDGIILRIRTENAYSTREFSGFREGELLIPGVIGADRIQILDPASGNWHPLLSPDGRRAARRLLDGGRRGEAGS